VKYIAKQVGLSGSGSVAAEQDADGGIKAAAGAAAAAATSAPAAPSAAAGGASAAAAGAASQPSAGAVAGAPAEAGADVAGPAAQQAQQAQLIRKNRTKRPSQMPLIRLRPAARGASGKLGSGTAEKSLGSEGQHIRVLRLQMGSPVYHVSCWSFQHLQRRNAVCVNVES